LVGPRDRSSAGSAVADSAQLPHLFSSRVRRLDCRVDRSVALSGNLQPARELVFEDAKGAAGTAELKHAGNLSAGDLAPQADLVEIEEMRHFLDRQPAGFLERSSVRFEGRPG
jgi:hypothetical protein